MMTKRGSGDMPMLLVWAALALIVLAILAIMFFRNNKGVVEATSCNNNPTFKCEPNQGKASCGEIGKVPGVGKCAANELCCAKDLT